MMKNSNSCTLSDKNEGHYYFILTHTMISSHNEFDKELLPICLVDVDEFALIYVKTFLSSDKKCFTATNFQNYSSEFSNGLNFHRRLIIEIHNRRNEKPPPVLQPFKKFFRRRHDRCQ